jgi:hypothetical protein
MDEQVICRLWRSSKGHFEVAVRWLVISMARSVGSAVSDVGCHLAAMIADVDITRCGA